MEKDWQGKPATSSSKSGSITSSTTTSGRNSRAVRTADVPSSAVRTSQRSIRNAMDISSANVDSSSTTRTRTGLPSGRRSSGEVPEADTGRMLPSWTRRLSRTCADPVYHL